MSHLFDDITKVGSMILRIPLIILLGSILAALILCIYLFAYVGTVVGILLIVAGILLLEPLPIFFGVVLGALGSFFYQEFFQNHLDSPPTLTELIERLL